MEKRFDVIGVGSLTIDIFAESPFKIIELNKKSHIALPTGKTISKVSLRSGGSAGNTVSYLSFLGLKCGFFSKLSYDSFSDFIIQDLVNFNVDISRIIRKKNLEVGKTVIVCTLGMKDTSLVVDHGAADYLSVSDVKKNLDYLLSTNWLDITSFGSKISVKAIEYLVRKSKKEGINIFFAPSKTMISTHRKKVIELLKLAKATSMNQNEVLLLSGRNSLTDALKFLKKLGIKYFFVTRGAEGIIAFFNKKFYKIKSYKVKNVKNTTGAGDIAAAWLLYGLIRDLDIRDILTYASVAAAIHVKSKYIGAKEGFASLDEIKNFFKKTRKLPVKEIKI